MYTSRSHHSRCSKQIRSKMSICTSSKLSTHATVITYKYAYANHSCTNLKYGNDHLPTYKPSIIHTMTISPLPLRVVANLAFEQYDKQHIKRVTSSMIFTPPAITYHTAVINNHVLSSSYIRESSHH